MNKILFTFSLFLLFASATGQYVLIPDSNFRHALISRGYASCFDSTQTMLDTTCSGVLESTNLIIEDSNIANIEGVQYFKHLTKLDCSYNHLDSLPQLPNTLSLLICDFNSLTALPRLPDSFTYITASENEIDFLPSLPNSLTYLNIESNNIHTLPSLPSSLSYFNCWGNPLDSFPTLPNQLSSFICGAFNIQPLPTLPASLRVFSCSYAYLDSLPLLPDSLVELDCYLNQLPALPLALPSKLQHLNCRNDQLTNIPPLPASLTYLDCSNNQLTFLPDLPDSMALLYCGFNRQLSCFPQLKTILAFNFDSTAIICLPDTGSITTSFPLISSLPLCGPNGCTVSGINEPSNTLANLNIYPNPAINQLNITLNTILPHTTLQITSTDGRTITQPIPIQQNHFELDISTLAAGIYFITLQNENDRVVKKFVKE